MIDLGGVNVNPSDLGVVGICILAVAAFMRGWIVRGKDRDEWREIALRSLKVSERTAGASEVAANALAALPDALELEDR